MDEAVKVIAKTPAANKKNKATKTQKSEFSQSTSSPVDQILFLQRTIGNQAVGKLINSGTLRAKLRIGQPGDIYEQEADRVAEQVMRMSESEVSKNRVVSGQAYETSIQRSCLKCTASRLQEEEVLQPREVPGLTHEVAPELETDINTIRGSGQPLPESARSFFEPRFGRDFSQVRVHTDANAAEAARAVNARAFTVGNDVVFGAGKYAPGTGEGQRLMAHELAHTIQQKATLPLTKSFEMHTKHVYSPVVSAESEAGDILQCDWSSSAKRGWEMYSGLKDEGAPFARELMRWRMIGLGMKFIKRPDDRDWNNFMVTRPEIYRAMAPKFSGLVTKFAAGGPTGSEWLGGWKYFSDSITDVKLNELESMRLTLHGCHRIDITGRYFVEKEGADTIVKLGSMRFTWIDRADLHPGTATELKSGAEVDDKEFTGAGWDYDISIQFEMPSISTWRVSGSSVTHIRGWPPEAGVPAAGFRG